MTWSSCAPSSPLCQSDYPRPKALAQASNVTTAITIVCETYELRRLALTGPRRHKQFTEARCLLYWLLRRGLGMSFPDIARAVGGRHHSTVMAGVRSHERAMAGSERLRELSAGLLRSLV